MANEITKIEVIGSGCGNCDKLRELTVKAVQELKLDVEVGHSDDVQKVLSMGVLQFPVLLVNGKAVLAGSTKDIEKIKKAILGEVKDCSCDRDESCGCDGGCGCGC